MPPQPRKRGFAELNEGATPVVAVVASGAAISVTWGRAWWGRIEVEGRWSVGGLAPGIGLGGTGLASDMGRVPTSGR